MYILEITAICYNNNFDKMYILFGIIFSFLKSYWYNICDMSHVTCHVSHITCDMSRVTCHVSLVTCHVSPFIYLYIYFLDNVLEGLLSTRSTLSSLCMAVLILEVHSQWDKFGNRRVL